MKSLLISIRPKWIEKILNGKKTLEIRKTAPKCDLPIDVYIYCTELHAKEVVSLFAADVRPYFGGRAAEFIERKRVDNRDMLWSICNGKVVAKFRLKHQFSFMPDLSFYDNGTREVLLKASCLSEEEIKKYANGSEFIYAWEISDLQIFDKPKNIWEFEHIGGYMSVNDCPKKERGSCNMGFGAKGYVGCERARLKRPPQSWCYVEVKE